MMIGVIGMDRHDQKDLEYALRMINDGLRALEGLADKSTTLSADEAQVISDCISGAEKVKEMLNRMTEEPVRNRFIPFIVGQKYEFDDPWLNKKVDLLCKERDRDVLVFEYPNGTEIANTVGSFIAGYNEDLVETFKIGVFDYGSYKLVERIYANCPKEVA